MNRAELDWERKCFLEQEAHWLIDDGEARIVEEEGIQYVLVGTETIREYSDRAEAERNLLDDVVCWLVDA